MGQMQTQFPPPRSGVPSCAPEKQLLSPTFRSGTVSLPDFYRVELGEASELGWTWKSGSGHSGDRALSPVPV